MWLDDRIIQSADNLTRNDLEILEDIKKISGEVTNFNIIEMAGRLHTSKSTLLRLAQKLGFKGYSEFKYHFSLNVQSNIRSGDDDLKNLIKKDIDQTIRLAENTNFASLVKLIRESKTIYCYGTGNSQKKALEEFSRLLLTIDKHVIVIPTSTEFPLIMSMISKNDVLFICSLNGNTPKIKEVISSLEKVEIPIIGISKFSQNYLSEHSDLMYYYYCTSFFDSNKNKERVSLIGLNVLLDWIHRECFIDYLNK